MINGYEFAITDEAANQDKEPIREVGIKIAEYNRHMQLHIDLLETAIEESDDPAEREKGRAAIRRLRQGIGGSLKK